MKNTKRAMMPQMLLSDSMIFSWCILTSSSMFPVPLSRCPRRASGGSPAYPRAALLSAGFIMISGGRWRMIVCSRAAPSIGFARYPLKPLER